MCTDQSSGVFWPLVMMELRKVGPMSDIGHCLTRHVRQGTEKWLDIDHQDVLMCPKVV